MGHFKSVAVSLSTVHVRESLASVSNQRQYTAVLKNSQFLCFVFHFVQFCDVTSSAASDWSFFCHVFVSSIYTASADKAYISRFEVSCFASSLLVLL